MVDTAMDGDVSGNLTYDPLGGLQLVRGVLIDAHFHERGRQVRLTSDQWPGPPSGDRGAGAAGEAGG